MVPNGVDAETFSPRNGRGGRPRAVVGCIGRLCRTKGQAVLQDAFARLDPGLGPVELWFVGEDQETGGAYRKVLEDQARDLGILDRVKFLGHWDDMAPLIGEMDLVVLPSFDEGMPLVLLEAMACAVPVVATLVGGVHELVDDGADGVLVAPGDAAGLANAVSRLLDDPGLRTRMGEAGRKKATERFELSRTLVAVREVYREVLAER
jgi:glycosyltransferase involved in cell wall biosynthesis